MPIIPKKLHLVWLGSLPPEDAKNNVIAWRDMNPDHEANLWIDSKTYPADKKDEFELLKQWAKENNVRLRDVNGSDFGLYRRMQNRKFYDKEISQPYANYAAAADILRVEFLYDEGGKYYDIRDIFPGIQMREMNPDSGFLCRWRYYRTREGVSPGTSNDILASMPKGYIIAAYRNVITRNYVALYKDAKKVRAHRDPAYLLPGASGRKTSTIDISGPNALNQALRSYLDSREDFYHPNKAKNVNEVAINDFTEYPDEFYSLPSKQRHDWYDNDYEEKNYKEVIRNYINIYLSYEIEEWMRGLGKSESKTIELLHQLDQFLLESPGNQSLIETYEQCKQFFDEQKLNNPLLKKILEKFKKIAVALEIHFFNFIKGLIDAEDIVHLFKVKAYSCDDLHKRNDFFELINTVFIDHHGHPSVDIFQKYFHFPLKQRETYQSDTDDITLESKREFKHTDFFKSSPKKVNWKEHRSFFINDEKVLCINEKHKIAYVVNQADGQILSEFKQDFKITNIFQLENGNLLFNNVHPGFIKILKMTGEEVSTFSTNGFQKVLPIGNNQFVGSSFLNGISIITTSGEIRHFDKLPYVTDMVFDMNQSHLLALDMNGLMRRYDVSGNVLKEFKSKERADKLFICKNGNILAIQQISNGSIFMYSPDGELLKEFNKKTPSNLHALLDNGMLACFDESSSSIELYNPESGQLVTKFSQSHVVTEDTLKAICTDYLNLSTGGPKLTW